MDGNFAGHETLRQRLLNKTHKYGNDDDYADRIMVRVFSTPASRNSTGGPNTKGGRYRVEMLPTTCHVYFGGDDRRHARWPPRRAAGIRRHFARAGRRSSRAHGRDQVGREDGPPQDRRHAPEHEVYAGLAGRRGESRQMAAHLVRGYFKMDGHHVQFNIVRGETLRQAQAAPEQHRDLIVRVAGYSDYFCDLSRELQEEIIARTEHAAF